MNKVVLLILTGMVALLTESCSFFSDFADARKELEEEAAKPIPIKVNTSQAKKTEGELEEEEFSDLEAIEPVQEIAGLIPATNPDNRVRSSVRGRQDPFSVVTLTPQIKIEEERVKQQVVSNRNQNRNQNPFGNRASNGNLPEVPAEVFEPTLAKDVVISGLYEAGGRTKLIVQAPEESTSRYVEVGQYLSNGQVLVKSIDIHHFPTPMVILEQSGVEVAKIIGENPENGDKIGSLPTENSQDKTLLSNISLNLE